MCKIDISGYNDLCSFFHSIACHSIFRHILQSGRNIIPHGFSVFKSKYHLLSGTQNYSRLRHDKLIRTQRFTLTLTFMPSNRRIFPFTFALTLTSPSSSTNGLITRNSTAARSRRIGKGRDLYLVSSFYKRQLALQDMKTDLHATASDHRQKALVASGRLNPRVSRFAIVASKGAVNTAWSNSYLASS